jgi:hypothetical protein
MPSSPRWTIAVAALVLGLSGAGASRALAGGPSPAGFAGTYLDSLPTRAEILQLRDDGTAHMTLSDEVTSGAGGFTFSDSLGSWRLSGPRRVTARFVNLNFDVSTAVPGYTGAAVVDYVLDFAPGLDTFQGSCQGSIYATGQDPFAPGATPVTTFDCAYLTGHPYRRVPLP